ncbi:Mannitol-specific phosphotransferase enzyme IIA component [[Clostridium] ultunense Esp]|nr:Mannitol-specific phosphotransferase enzyme IIA component [[Clostridium] ultunense Esp]
MIEYLPEKNIILSGKASNKEEAIKEVADILITNNYVSEEYLDKMYEREESVSTYIGNYLAIPHGVDSSAYVNKTGLAFIRYDKPIDWDENKVYFVIGIASKNDNHIDILSKIAILFSDENNVDGLKAAKDEREIIETINSVKN